MTKTVLESLTSTGSGDSEGLIMGRSFAGFLENVVSDEARAAAQAAAEGVLTAAISHGPGSTGLVVGRVQSGKTQSYEAVIALARDNGFSVVIVVSGVSNNLLHQGEVRLKRDLEIADPDAWTFLSPADPGLQQHYVRDELIRVRDNWASASTPAAYKKTAVVFLLKHHGRIADLAAMVAKAEFAGAKCLIVDDEADQASLNALAKKDKESSTFASIRELRQAFPQHYYLQYTATPQAPLLVALQDALSPDYVRTLEPGNGYIGGEAYFEKLDSIVHSIPEDDLNASEDQGGPPPESLKRAVREFVIGAAHVVASGKPATRSMLVHPAHDTAAQSLYAGWVRGLRSHWLDLYENYAPGSPSKMFDELKLAWQSLADTYADIRDFNECWDALGLVLRNLDVVEVNTRVGPTPKVNWDKTKAFILVGGQAVNRGFTVEGLTVTYMPRNAGMSLADTIQQRARFFGYKSDYFGLCRVYLASEVKDAFASYVVHEKEMISTLRAVEAGSESLKDWKRKFLLDPSMRLTREAVIGLDIVRVETADRWVVDRFPLREDAVSFEAGSAALNTMLSNVTWEDDPYGNQFAFVSTDVALEVMQSTSADSLLIDQRYQVLQLAIASISDRSDVPKDVCIFKIRFSKGSKRAVSSRGRVQVFQGRSSAGQQYPGDSAIYAREAALTVQLHHVRVMSAAERDVFTPLLVSAWRLGPVFSDSASWLVQVDE